MVVALFVFDEETPFLSPEISYTLVKIFTICSCKLSAMRRKPNTLLT
jgi:hypothetical protein